MAITTDRTVHLSHSQVSEFTRCPRKYHLHYRPGLPAAFCPSGLLFRSVVHEAIARYQQARLEGKEAHLSDLVAACRERWDAEGPPVRAKAGESVGLLMRKAERLLGCYLSNPHSAGEVLAVEEPFTVELCPGVPPVRGVIDLVERTAEGGRKSATFPRHI